MEKTYWQIKIFVYALFSTWQIKIFVYAVKTYWQKKIFVHRIKSYWQIKIFVPGLKSYWQKNFFVHSEKSTWQIKKFVNRFYESQRMSKSENVKENFQKMIKTYWQKIFFVHLKNKRWQERVFMYRQKMPYFFVHMVNGHIYQNKTWFFVKLYYCACTVKNSQIIRREFVHIVKRHTAQKRWIFLYFFYRAFLDNYIRGMK